MKQKKIVHVITTLDRGGAENQLFILVSEQIVFGYEIVLVSLKGNGELTKDFSALGVTVTELNGKSLISQVLALRNIFSENDLIHSHLPRSEIVSGLAILGKNIPWVISRHNTERFWPSLPRGLSSLLSRVVTKQANIVIAISYEVERYIAAQREISSKSASKVRVVRYGIPKIRESHKVVGKRDFSFHIGVAARLERQKDLSTLLDAFYILRNSSRNSWRLSIAGAGSLFDELQHMTIELHLEDSVKLLGKLQELDHFYESIDVFVLPSKYEGFGLVLLEAMKKGIPIVSSSIATSIEILGGNFPAFFPVGDSLQLSKILKKMSNKEFRTEICSEYESRLSLFDSKRMAKEITNIYNSV